MVSNYYLLMLLCCFGSIVFASVLEESDVEKVFHYQPEQVHLAFGEEPNELVVTWSTRDDAIDSVVEYATLDAFSAKNVFTLNATGTSTLFVDGGSKQKSQYIHRVKLTQLNAATRYVYHCGSPLGWSAKFEFRTVPPTSADWSPTLAIYGDMGNENAQSLPRLQEDTQRGMYDAILHVGDFAYDMHSENATIGDEFMRQIESIAAYVPYMTVPGNHEERYNFSNYRARFSMPGGTENLFYSFNLGPVHFIGISTEVYYFLNYGLKTLIFQYDWLEQDLREANKPGNRQQRPWIIVYGHRPMYCSNENDNDCTHSETLTRVGWPFVHMFGLEELFYKYGVDVEIWAHEHSYERTWPLYDYKVYNGSMNEPYRNPRAPVHVVTGSAGCKEGREPFIKNIAEWSAFHSQVTLRNLKAKTRYIYHCGSSLGWSAQYWFRTPPTDAAWSPSLAIYGDMGNENAQSLPRLQEDTQRGMYDAILHVGDFAYDMHSENGMVGDEFMRQIETIAAYVPYMTVAGNHEEAYNFSNYRARFSMPGGTENLFYSFNLGPVHFIGISTEVYYFLKFGLKLVVQQYDWLERDLQEANRPENRALRPWIITYGHRPMYCSNDNGDDCSKRSTVVRKGLPVFGLDMFGLEELFYDHGVDVEIWAHEHCYERLWPLYNYTVHNGSLAMPYHNPKAPVHVITGAAGNKEGREPFFKVIPEWSAYHSQDFGYTRLKAYNKSHLHFEQVSDDKQGAIIDSFWVVKHTHGRYN